MNNPENPQLSLFEAGSHDYSDPVAGEYPFVRAGESLSGDDKEGVSVNLEERYKTLRGAAEVYARYASRTIGLGRAALDPAIRDQLNRRYEDADRVVSGAKENSFYTVAPSELDLAHPSDEQRMLEGVLKTRELVDAGFDPIDVVTIAQQSIVGIRHAIGVDVGQRVRNVNLRQAKKSADRANRLR